MPEENVGIFSLSHLPPDTRGSLNINCVRRKELHLFLECQESHKVIGKEAHFSRRGRRERRWIIYPWSSDD